MAEDERVPGSTVSLEDDAEHENELERRLAELIDAVSAADVDLLYAIGEHLVLLGSRRLDTPVQPVPFDVDLLVQLAGRARGIDVTHESQPPLPGVVDRDHHHHGRSDRAFLVTTALLEGLGAETLSHLHDRISEDRTATDVPIRALRNPGKVLGELAEKGQIARVTNHGKIVGWLMPATEAEQHVDDLLRQGRLRRGTPAPIEPIDVPGLERPLSEILTEARDEERS